MKPTNELRWVLREYRVPVKGETDVFMVENIKILQQKWIKEDVGYSRGEPPEEWRDVPVEDK